SGLAAPRGAASMEFLWPVARHARRARQGLGTDARARLVPLRHGAALETPVFSRVVVGGHHGGAALQGGTGLARRFGPVLFEIAGGGVNRLFDVAGCVFYRFLHLL